MSVPLIRADVERITPLTDSILQLILTPEVFINYEAGQYLQIMLNNELLSYSIANAPLGSHKYELHIRHSRDNPITQNLLAKIKECAEVFIRLPLGTCELSQMDSSKPILFIAAGTGYAPINAMIEQLLALGEPRPFELYWGARSQSDLYMDEKVRQWQNHVSHFKYFSLLSDAKKETLASMALARHKLDINEWQIVLSGPFDMVYDTRDWLVSHGASPENLYSDAFSFEDPP